MRTPFVRPTCSSRKAFTPSTVLWQYFVVPHSSRRFFSRPRCYQQQAQPSPDGQLSEVAPSPAEAAPPIWPKDPRAPFRRHLINPSDRSQIDPDGTEPDGLKAMKKALRALETSGDYDGVVIHPFTENKGVDEGPPWYTSKGPWIPNPMDRLSKEIEEFCREMRPLPPVAQARDAIAERIRRAIRRKYNYCDVEVIGSQRTGLALNISDIDLRLFIPSKDTAPSKTSKVGTVPDKNDNAPGTEPSVRFLYNIAGYLAVLKEYDKPVYEDLEVFYSKVPLLNFYDYRSGLKIQLVSSKDSSAARGKVAQYVEEYPYLPDLYTVVKTMFDARGLSDVFMGGFGSYPIFMMIVASLQHLPRERAPSGVGPALVHFLEYWSLFDTTNGVALDPPEYFDKAVHPVMSPSAAYKLAQGTRKPLPQWMLCLRDPADPENDLGRKGASIKHVQVTCMHLMNMAHDMLQGPLDNAQQSSSLLQHIVGPAYSTAKPPREADPRVQKLYEHSLRRIEALRWLRAKKSIISPQPPKKGVITYWSLDADRKVEKTESEQTETTTGIIMRKIAKNGDLTPAEKIQAEKIAAVKLAKKDDSKPTENGETTAGNDEPAPFKIRKIAHEPLPFKIRKKVPNRAVSESESSTFDQSRTARKAEGGSEDEG